MSRCPMAMSQSHSGIHRRWRSVTAQGPNHFVRFDYEITRKCDGESKTGAKKHRKCRLHPQMSQKPPAEVAPRCRNADRTFRHFLVCHFSEIDSAGSQHSKTLEIMSGFALHLELWSPKHATATRKHAKVTNAVWNISACRYDIWLFENDFRLRIQCTTQN